MREMLGHTFNNKLHFDTYRESLDQRQESSRKRECEAVRRHLHTCTIGDELCTKGISFGDAGRSAPHR